MIDLKWIELMNREIDNIITPDEKKRLFIYLSENAEAKEYYDNLRLTTDSLNTLTDPVPPVNLKKKIINSINFDKYIPAANSGGNSKFNRLLKFKYAYTFAAGLIAGLIIYSLFSANSNTVNPDEISGTIGINEETITLDEIPIVTTDFRGNIAVQENEKNLWVKINSNSSLPVDLTITYPVQIQFENIKPGKYGDIKLSNSKNYVQITNSGSQHYTVNFTKISLPVSPLHILLSQSGNKIYECEIALNR